MREPGPDRPESPRIQTLPRKRSFLLAAGALVLATAPAAQGDDSLFFAGPEVCEPDIIEIPKVVEDAAGLDPSTQEIVLESDGIEAPDGDTLILTGNAQVIQGPQAIFAEEIVFNKAEYSLNARDDVTIYSPGGDKMEAASLVLQLETFIGDADQVDFQLGQRPGERRKRRLMDSGDTRQGSFDLGGMEDASWLSDSSDFLADDHKFSIDIVDAEGEDADGEGARPSGPPRAELRGEAERLFFEGQDRQRLQKARLTACRMGQDSVYLNAGEVTLDHATGVGEAKHMSVRFFKVPIFYFPRVTFPINDERKTGFLFPSIGTSDRSGTIVEIPYYINIAPHMDATVNMRYLSDRGVQVMGEYRYLGERHDGVVRAEILPGDDVYGDDRYAWGYDHRQDFGENWNTRIDVQDVSDPDYFDDFSNDIEISSSSFLSQRAEVNYNGDVFRFGASVLDYVSTDSALDPDFEPYGRLPRLTLNADAPREIRGPFRFGFDSELVRFAHPGNRIEGTRFNAVPFVSLPWENVFSYVTPRVSVSHTTYSLDNVDPGEEDSPNFTVPVFSLDAGIYFERDTTWHDRPHYQTLEPRLYYVYAPEEDQTDVPVFDTGGGNLSSIGNYYRDNRFYGPDRVGDENRITLGLTSRLIDSDNGQQRLQAEIAQIFYLDDREVQVSPIAEPETEDKSDLLGEIRANLTERWEVGASAVYSHESSETEVIRLDTEYSRDSRRWLRASYWYFKDFSEQLDLDLSWPLASRWQVGLETQYDIEEGEHLASAASITYDACCWAARVSAERRRNRVEEDEAAIFFTLELKNLGRFSTNY